MAAYVLRRVFWTIPILFVVLSLIFFAMLSIGGDPTRHGRLVGLSSAVWVKSGDPKPDAITDNMRRVRGLDQPWYEQYARYLKATVTFDYGATFTFPYRTVEGIIAAQAPVSLELGLLALLWALVVGLPLGVAGALVRGSPLDLAARTLALLGVAVPNFLVATLLIYVLSVRGGLLPTSGWGSWQAKVLPSLTLSLLPMAYCARLVRASMLEVLHQDYVRAGAARGLRRSRIVGVHVLRNSLIPLVSALGPIVGYLVTGSFVIEQIFGIPGIGRYYVAAVLARDYPLVLGLTVVLTMAMVLANLLADIVLVWLDPRLRERILARA